MNKDDEDKRVTWEDLEDMLLEDNKSLNWTDQLRIKDGHYKRQMSKEDLDFMLEVLNYIILCSYDIDSN